MARPPREGRSPSRRLGGGPRGSCCRRDRSQPQAAEPLLHGGAPHGREPLGPVRVVGKHTRGLADRLRALPASVKAKPLVQQSPYDLGLGNPEIPSTLAKETVLFIREIDLRPTHTSGVYINRSGG